ncbi:hypothetical protein G5I_07933 [Acromyrmex echinatior]|uniref:Uncharacterized protein n=1 Tax=Acromyrmex echinatior TaxID=103372 RepID=F4WQ73_ACREC|nr:hypothetical protein G5I_07933 [Acromyrmex echinatior]
MRLTRRTQARDHGENRSDTYSHRFEGKTQGDDTRRDRRDERRAWMLQEARSSHNDDVPLSVKSFAPRPRRTPEKVAIQQNSASTGTKAYVIAADTERMEIAVVQWREVEAHNLSNVDAKPLTLPCSVIAHLTKPRCETSTFPSSLSSEGYRETPRSSFSAFNCRVDLKNILKNIAQAMSGACVTTGNNTFSNASDLGTEQWG